MESPSSAVGEPRGIEEVDVVRAGGVGDVGGAARSPGKCEVGIAGESRR